MQTRENSIPGVQASVKRWVLYLTGVLLAFSGGAVNGVATAALVFGRTAHMSGPMNDLLRNLIFDLPNGLLAACLIVSFMVGAYCSGILVPRRGVTSALWVSAALLTAGAGAAALKTGQILLVAQRYIVGFLLALSAGLQNGATSQVDIGRTTHVTGDLTDMAVAMSEGNRAWAAFLFAKLAAFAGGGLAGFMGIRYSLPVPVLLLSALMVVAGTLCWLTTGANVAATRNHAAAAAGFERQIRDRVREGTDFILLDFSGMPSIDLSAARSVEEIVREAQEGGKAVYLVGMTPEVRSTINSVSS
jgi:uncharacterized membrane protein YoaK (UPF0700 family)